MNEQQEELLRQQKLEAEREKLTEQQRQHLDVFCENLKLEETYKTEYAIKACKIIETEEGYHQKSQLNKLTSDADWQGRNEDRQAAAKLEAEPQASAEQAQEQPTQAVGIPEYGAQQELLPRDRDHTQIGRYDELKALSEAQRPQENQSSVTAEWQPAAIEVLGSTASPRGPDDGQSPNGPTEGPHSPAPQPELTNGPDHQDTLRAMAEHQPAVDPSPMPQQSAEHQDTFQAMMNGQPGAEPTSVQHGADHQDTLQVMKDEHPAADHSREQHDNDLMKDFVTQETKDQLAAQERQQDFQRQRENEKSMSM